MNTNTNRHINPHFGGLLAIMAGDPLLRRQPLSRSPIPCDMAAKATDQWTHAAFVARVQSLPYTAIRCL